MGVCGDLLGRWVARGPPSPGPIKSVKIMWSRELCSLGDLPDDSGGSQESSGAGTGGLVSAALWTTLVSTLEVFCGWGEGDHEEPTGWRWQSWDLSLLALMQKRGRIECRGVRGVIFNVIPGAFTLLSCLGSSGGPSCAEAVGASWCRAGSWLSGHTFQRWSNFPSWKSASDDTGPTYFS